MFTRGTVPYHVLINHEMEVVYTARGYIMPPFGNEFLSVLNNSLSELSTLSIEDISMPIKPGIQNCYPNPFNPSITINFELSEKNYTNISVYNLLGERIDKLVSDNFNAGYHSINWDAGNIASGVYIVKVIAGSNIASQKIMLLK